MNEHTDQNPQEQALQEPKRELSESEKKRTEEYAELLGNPETFSEPESVTSRTAAIRGMTPDQEETNIIHVNMQRPNFQAFWNVMQARLQTFASMELPAHAAYINYFPLSLAVLEQTSQDINRLMDNDAPIDTTLGDPEVLTTEALLRLYNGYFDDFAADGKTISSTAPNEQTEKWHNVMKDNTTRSVSRTTIWDNDKKTGDPITVVFSESFVTKGDYSKSATNTITFSRPPAGELSLQQTWHAD